MARLLDSLARASRWVSDVAQLLGDAGRFAFGRGGPRFERGPFGLPFGLGFRGGLGLIDLDGVFDGLRGQLDGDPGLVGHDLLVPGRGHGLAEGDLGAVHGLGVHGGGVQLRGDLHGLLGLLDGRRGWVVVLDAGDRIERGLVLRREILEREGRVGDVHALDLARDEHDQLGWPGDGGERLRGDHQGEGLPAGIGLKGTGGALLVGDDFAQVLDPAVRGDGPQDVGGDIAGEQHGRLHLLVAQLDRGLSVIIADRRLHGRAQRGPGCLPQGEIEGLARLERQGRQPDLGRDERG